jgi:hypothetical protein
MGWANLFAMMRSKRKKHRQRDHYARRNGQSCVQPHLDNMALSRADF